MSGHTGGSQGWAISFESELALRQKGGSCVRRNTEEQGNISFLPSSGFYSALASHVYGKRWHRSKGKIGQLRAFLLSFLSVQFSSVAQLCLTLCDPMNCSMPGLSVHYQLPEFIQTHVHPVGDAIQPSHPLSSPSPPALNLSQHQGLFK